MKKFILLLIVMLVGTNAFSANSKLPVKIRPLTEISTAYDEFEVGDIIPFDVIYDVYNGDKVIIPAGTMILGTIDYLSENGWCGDNAQIEFKKFVIDYPDGRTKEFTSELTIDGFQTLKYYHPKWKRFFQYIGSAFRGKEVYVPLNHEVEFNIWYCIK